MANIIDKIMGMMTDDKGIFQGGKYKRVGGRVLDTLEGTVGPEQQQETAGRALAGAMGVEPPSDASPGEKVTFNPFQEGDPRMSTDFSMARILALDFDPSNETDILKLQKRLNEAGYKGEDGKALDVDGKFGKNTLHALRNIQSDMKTSDPTALPK